MVSFAGKGFVPETTIDPNMVRFSIDFIQSDMKGEFVVSNFDQFFKCVIYVFTYSFRISDVVKSEVNGHKFSFRLKTYSQKC